jgi:hypothetical protein
MCALLTTPSLSSSSPASSYDTSMVQRLLTDRDILIQDGLSYFNDTTLKVRLKKFLTVANTFSFFESGNQEPAVQLK